jgi:WD40 repeat protein
MRRDKKPFAKVRTIDLKKAHLPTTMQFPELALSPTSPLLVAASGPRTPRAGRPPPFRETLLVAWEIDDYREVSNEPYRVLKPWDHRELNNSCPFSLFTYGSLAVSIWIPASQRSEARGSTMTGSVDFKLVPVDVAFRYVLVWDMSKDSTRLYPIPNTTSCISPDCRFVAYCQIADRLSKLAVLDATTGEEVWCVGGEGNLKSIEQFGDLSQITDLAFSPDGRLLFLGDAEGTTRVCDVGEVN